MNTCMSYVVGGIHKNVYMLFWEIQFMCKRCCVSSYVRLVRLLLYSARARAFQITGQTRGRTVEEFFWVKSDKRGGIRNAAAGA